MMRRALCPTRIFSSCNALNVATNSNNHICLMVVAPSFATTGATHCAMRRSSSSRTNNPHHGVSLFDTLHLRRQYALADYRDSIDPQHDDAAAAAMDDERIMEPGPPQPFISYLLRQAVPLSVAQSEFTYSVELVPPVRDENIPKFLTLLHSLRHRMPQPPLFVALARKADVTQNEATRRCVYAAMDLLGCPSSSSSSVLPIPVLWHVVGREQHMTLSKLQHLVEWFAFLGGRNVLALRGDGPPPHMPPPFNCAFKRAVDVVRAIHAMEKEEQRVAPLCMAVAGYPEGYSYTYPTDKKTFCPKEVVGTDREGVKEGGGGYGGLSKEDLSFQADKIEEVLIRARAEDDGDAHAAGFVITQMLSAPGSLLEYRLRLLDEMSRQGRRSGTTAGLSPIIVPSLLAPMSQAGCERMARITGVSLLPQIRSSSLDGESHRSFEEAMTTWTVQSTNELFDMQRQWYPHLRPHVHYFCGNSIDSVETVLRELLKVR